MFLMIAGTAYAVFALTLALAVSRAARDSDVALAQDESAMRTPPVAPSFAMPPNTEPANTSAPAPAPEATFVSAMD